MSYTEVIKATDATALVERTHKMSGPQQMFREIPVNAAQAGANELRVDAAWGIVEQGGRYFASFEDDGEGMTPSQMPQFLNQFGGSGRTIGVADDNFGVGFKTATWPVNEAGVVILTLRNNITSMMWCWRDPITGSLGARGLIDSHTFGDNYDDAVAESGSPTVLVLESPHSDWEEMIIGGIDWMKVMPQWIKDAGHGTAFILMGDGESDTYETYGYDKNPTKYTALKEMSKRFWSFDLDVKVRSFTNWSSRSSWPVVRPAETAMWRKVVTTMDHVYGSDIVTHSGSVELTASTVAATVEWFLFDQPRERGSQSGDRISHPFRAVTHTAHDGIVEMLDMKSGAAKDVSPFVGPRTVARNIGIIVTPTGGNVFIDGSRTVLRHQREDGITAEMPWDEWAAEFRHKLPTEIQALVDAHYSESSSPGEVTAEERQRFGQRFLAFLRGTTTRLRPDIDGTTTGSLEVDPTSVGRDTTHTDRPPRKRRKNAADNSTVQPGTNQRASERPRSVDLPEPHWEPAGEFDPGCAVRYDATDHKVFLNSEHFFVEQTDAYIADRYKDETSDEVARRILAVKNAMLTNVMLGTAFAIGNSRKHPEQTELLSSVGLTSLLADIRGNMAEGMALYGQENQRRNA